MLKWIQIYRPLSTHRLEVQIHEQGVEKLERHHHHIS